MIDQRVLAGASTLPPANTTRPKRPSKKSSSRFTPINAFVDVHMATLSRGEIVVWMLLWRDTKNGTVRTSQADMARRCGMSKRGVQKALKKLIDAKFVRLIHRGGINVGPSVYRANVPL